MATRLSITARRVLELLATGRSTTEVADVLGVSSWQVRHDLFSAMVMLGAYSKLEAVVMATQDGLIDPTRFA